MPRAVITKAKNGGYRFGTSGKTYPTRAELLASRSRTNVRKK